MAQQGQQHPLRAAEVLNLVQMGIPENSIRFKTLSVQSVKYICVNNEQEKSVIVVDTEVKQTMKLPLGSDSAIMNPVSRVIGFRAGMNLQILNLEMRSKMKATTMTEPVVFWKWLNSNTIAIVTDQSVYHWSMDGDAQPDKIFDRTAFEGAVQIINYQASADNKWLILGGITNRNNQIEGVLQLYSVERSKSQPTLDAHAACFSTITLEGKDTPSNLFCFTQKTPEGAKVSVVEVGVPKEQAFKIQVPLQFHDQADFAVAMLPDNKHSMLWILTKLGYLFLYDVTSGRCIFARQVSPKTMFASVSDPSTGGVMAVDSSGRVVKFQVDEAALIPYICGTLNDLELGVKLATLHNLPGAENIFRQQFDRLMQANDIPAAAKLAAEAPQGILRTPETIQRFKSIPTTTGRAPVLQYFALLMQRGKLNKAESFDLAGILLQAGKKHHIEEWLKQDKFDYSEDLGQLLKPHDIKLACSVFLRARVPEKAIGCFLQMGQWEKVVPYARSVPFTPDFALLVQQLHRIQRDEAKRFALQLIQWPEGEGGPLLDAKSAVEIFVSQNDFETATALLLEYLKPRGDREEDGELQTRLYEINLLSVPEVAAAIMDSSEYHFTKFNRQRIAQLCERAQLYQHALVNYEQLEDQQRVMLNTHMIEAEFLLNFFADLPPEDCLSSLKNLLSYNQSANLNLVVEAAKRYENVLTSKALIALFEEFKSYSGLYYFLGASVNNSQDPDFVFTYLKAAAHLNQFPEVERICRDHDYYNPEQVKDWLLAQNLKDPRSLIHVCDRFGFVAELTRYLYNNNLERFIEVYVQKLSANATPIVIGTLMELGAPDEYYEELLKLVPAPQADPDLPQSPCCPIKELVEQVEKHNRLRLLLPWLEARFHEGNTDVYLHNALAKIYVDLNSNPIHFLTNNKYYDPAVVGEYCESINPQLSLLAYKRGEGKCDHQLIEVANKYGFFKDLAKHLVERQDKELWEIVLRDTNPHRREVIDQVVATALPESKVPEEVSVTVQAFMCANMPNELIELLEKIVLHGAGDSSFHTNRNLHKNLQNLLIHTAIKADRKRVMDYINRLDNFDGPEIAKIAIHEQYRLFEEAFVIYQKFKKYPEAINVLLNNIEDLQRAHDFADVVNEPPVWSLLGKAQMDANMMVEAITSFIKADDPTEFESVISSAQAEGFYKELIPFLLMAREKVSNPAIDDELIVCYAKADNLVQLEEFVASNHSARIEHVGDRCFEEELYSAARILFTSCKQNAKLALCLIRLGKYADACEAARKANKIESWKAVCYACVDAKEFRLAQVCGLQIIVVMEHLGELIRYYELRGHFEQVIALLEQGISLDRRHQGMYTSLGTLYAKYNEEKLMEHIKLFWQRLNIPTLLTACKENAHWNEAVFLYVNYNQYDNAVDVMIVHSADCWSNNQFKEIVSKVSNTEVFYKALDFYLEQHPLLVKELLIELSPKLDHIRVISKLRQVNHLALAQKYLLHVQHENLAPVNEAVNELFVEEENYKSLRESIHLHDNFDQFALAKKLEKHELLEFRRISAYLYKLNKRFEKSLDMSKQDRMYADAMVCAADSRSKDLAENLLQFFVQNKERECFSACLYQCYPLISPDLAMELAWRNGLTDFVMPFLIQTIRTYSDRVVTLETKIAEREAAELAAKASAAAEENEQAISGQMGMPGVPLALPPPQYVDVGGVPTPYVPQPGYQPAYNAPPSYQGASNPRF